MYMVGCIYLFIFLYLDTSTFLTGNNRENFDKCKLCTVRNIKNKTFILPEKNLCLSGTEGTFSAFPTPSHRFNSLHLIRNSYH